MKAYLATTGTLFGLMTAVHVWKIVAEWNYAGNGPGYFLGMAAVILLTAALSYWAWVLFRRQSKA